MKNAIIMTLVLFISMMTLSSQAIETGDKTENKKVKTTDKKTMTISPEMKAAMVAKDNNSNTQPANVVDGLSTSERFVKYLHSGFIHIIPKGIDHILFVLGLFLSTIMFRKLVWQVTTFTLAHSISLGLAASGVISISADIIEPLIALSIAFVAFENIRNSEAGSSRLIMIFIFGLLHGLGFAFVLTEFGLPSNSFLTSLFAFNIGVEVGQLTVLALAGILLYSWSKKPSYRMFVQIPGSVLIGFVGLYWTIERLLNI
ncbi:HupE/UreJ family protein [Psychrosphaera aquimarina]|uniref:HupE/UreJ family protein n=1 Tax=Psychrosphaera aquimarina TaxID=2044854 RepID=A0ABU3QZB4_9GAMM|nr:HupE/UreJ family protein [Psychrosphaera aquimarina]MDU0112779.1 HupE/UreJ family protein [Psychrosphaera aquimarina]